MKIRWIYFLICLFFVFSSVIPTDYSYANAAIKVTKKKLSEDVERIHYCNRLFGCMNIYKKSAGTEIQVQRTLVMFVGLNTDHNFIKKIDVPPEITVLAVEYPIIKDVSLNKQIIQLVTDHVQIQGLIASFFLWLKSEKEFNQTAIDILMVSFGTYITPKPLALAQEFGFSPASTIFAYGGAGLKHFFNQILSEYMITEDETLLADVKKSLERLFRGFETEKVLGKLSGPFLVIVGGEDEVIPAEASDALFGGLSEPKKHVIILGPHIGVDQDEAIKKTMAILMDWFKANPKYSH